MSFDFVLREISNTPVPFDILKSLHLNVMVLWLLLGFIGGLYFLIPEEVGRDVKHPSLF